MIEGRNVTARNYAAQAEAALRELIRNYDDRSEPVDKWALEWLADSMSTAVHFASPDNAKIFGDKLKGLEGMELALPYPRMTLEYFVERDEELLSTGLATEYAPKRVLYLEEIDRDQLEQSIAEGMSKAAGTELSMVGHAATKLSGNKFILLVCVCVVQNAWTPLPWSFVFQCENWRDTTSSQDSVVGEKGFLLPQFARSLLRQNSAEYILKLISLDLGPEISAALEFIEAMSCSNIVEMVHDKGAKASVNEKRRRQGKVPFHETKTLTIDPTWLEKYKKRAAASVSGRKSPKFHYRRSHTRTINRGKENQYTIRIPRLEIGSPEFGTVTKNYKIVKKKD